MGSGWWLHESGEHVVDCIIIISSVVRGVGKEGARLEHELTLLRQHRPHHTTNTHLREVVVHGCHDVVDVRL